MRLTLKIVITELMTSDTADSLRSSNKILKWWIVSAF